MVLSFSFFFSSRRRHTRSKRDWSSDVCSSDLELLGEDGTPVATVDSSTFARKHGGFGGRMSDTPVPHTVPQTAPELICDLPTRSEERRVGKECRTRWSRYVQKKEKNNIQ